MFWINGQQHDAVAVADRGLQFGDGCFTTARVVAGNIVWLERHLARLSEDAARLRLPAVDWQQLEAEMVQVVQGTEQGVLKVILTRGSGGRGYSAQQCDKPTRILMLSCYPAHYTHWRAQGIMLGTSPISLGQNPALAGIKHLNRLEQVLIRCAIEEQGVDEAVVLDSEGYLVECCAANLFWRKGNQVFTPDLSRSGVNGLARQHVLSRLATLPAFTLHVVRAPLHALAEAEEVFICNALMPVIPVNGVDAWRYRSSTLYQLLSPDSELMVE